MSIWVQCDMIEREHWRQLEKMYNVLAVAGDPVLAINNLFIISTMLMKKDISLKCVYFVYSA